MINKIIVSNFKLFKECTEFNLGNVNLLTGINGRGKSSFLQILLLMKQTIDSDYKSRHLLFNGSHVQLGSFSDVKNYDVRQGEPILFQFFSSDNHSIHYFFEEDTDDKLCANISICNFTNNGEIMSPCHIMDKTPCLFENLLPITYESTQQEISEIENGVNIKHSLTEQFHFSGIHYISADRIGPKLFYKQESLKEFNSVGAQGENTVNTLFHFKDNVLEDDFIEILADAFELESDDIGRTVELQLEFWLTLIFGGTKIKIQHISDANLLSLSLATDETSLIYFKPTNVGYGYTYVLPIIVACLTAKKGEILIIENPEAHLHPSAQSTLAKLLALLKYRGVQVFIESHSDHILNGLQLAVFDRLIENNDLNILYFNRGEHQGFVDIGVDERGHITNWPQGFFDQATIDLNKLLEI